MSMQGNHLASPNQPASAAGIPLPEHVHESDDDDNCVDDHQMLLLNHQTLSPAKPLSMPYAPLSRGNKVLAFASICFLGFGAYFASESLSALQPHFQTDMQISPSKFMLFSTLSNWASVICGVAGGIIIDSVLGLRWSGILFASCALLGQLVFATSIFYNCYPMALLGRFIFGFGTDSLSIIQNAYTVRFFRGSNINMLFGIHLTFLRLGSVLALNVQETIYVSIGKWLDIHGTTLLGTTLHVSSILVSLSVLSAINLYSIDREHEPKLQAKEFSRSQANARRASLGEILKNVIDGLSEIDPKIWHVAATVIFFYNGLTPVYPQGVFYLKNKYSMSGTQAGRTLSFIDLISATLAPLVGYIADRFKNNVYLGQMGIILTLCGLSLLNFTFVSPIICVILMGLGFSSLSSSMWPYINTNVPNDRLGIVNGTISSVQSAILGGVILSFGFILQREGYFISYCLLMINLIFALTLNTNFLIIHGKGVSAVPPNSHKSDELNPRDTMQKL